MANKIQISSKDAELGILTYRGLPSEMDQENGMLPINWLRFFIGRNEEDEYPEYNRIQYLKNVNIQAFANDDTLSPHLPSWHAAVVLLDDDAPVGVLLISESRILDTLVQRYPPMMMIQHTYPKTNISQIKVTLDDAEEKPIRPSRPWFTGQYVKVYRGWPAECYRQQYERVKKQAEQIAASMGTTSTMQIDYRMTTSQFELDLHFEYCMVDDRRVIFILNDIPVPEEAW